jgi:hypothetical protein
MLGLGTYDRRVLRQVRQPIRLVDEGKRTQVAPMLLPAGPAADSPRPG